MRAVWLLLSCTLLCSAASASAQFQPIQSDETPSQLRGEDLDTAALALRTWARRSAEALAQTGRPRELAFAAALRDMTAVSGGDETSPAVVSPDATSAGWRRQADAQAGDDVLTNMLLAGGGEEGIRLRAAQRWLGADAQNLAPLLARRGRAELLLSDARSSTYLNMHMLEQVRWMRDALLRVVPDTEERAALSAADAFIAEEHAAVQAMAIWSAIALPDPTQLIRTCDADLLQGSQAMEADCRHIASLMAERSDTQFGEMLGLTLLERIAGSSAERAQVRMRLRGLDWRNLEWGRVSMASPRDGASTLVRLLAEPSVRTEQQLVSRVLQDAGIPSDPPPGWRP